MTTAVDTPIAGAAPARSSIRRFLSHSWTLTWRCIIETVRDQELLFFTFFQPVMFVVLFRYVFGGAITIPGGIDYVQLLIPGIAVQTVAFASAGTAIGLADDMKKGIMDRFRALPIVRSAVLTGRIGGDLFRTILTTIIIVIVGYAVGFRFNAGLLAALGFVALLILLGGSMAWIAANIGLRVDKPETAQSALFTWLFPLTFISGAFTPVETYPGWLQAVAKVNPLYYVVRAAEALANGGPTATPVLQSIGFCLVVVVIFAPLAVARYRRI